MAHLVFRKAIAQFGEIEHHKAEEVVRYLKYLRLCFFSSWCMFPLLWLISAQGACIADEDIVSSIHIPADVVAKNVFGIILWHIRFHLCDGYFDMERFKQRLMQDELLDLHDDPDSLRQRHVLQAEACYKLADDCISNANLYLRRAAAIDQGLETLRDVANSPNARTRKRARSRTHRRTDDFVSVVEDWWKRGSRSNRRRDHALFDAMTHGTGPRAYLERRRSQDPLEVSDRGQGYARDSVRSGVWVDSVRRGGEGGSNAIVVVLEVLAVVLVLLGKF